MTSTDAVVSAWIELQLQLQGDSLPLEALWSPIVAKPYLVFAQFKVNIRAKFNPEYGSSLKKSKRWLTKMHFKIRLNEEPIGSWLEMENSRFFWSWPKILTDECPFTSLKVDHF